jgi:hypothetical protein
MIELPPIEHLKTLLDYNPETGQLIWRSRPFTSKANGIFNVKHAGKEAGALESWGYRQIRIDGRLTMAHRIIWKMMTGKNPPEQLDHINGDVSDNRWSNLRDATAEQNAWNRRINRNNTSGYPCIYPMYTKRATSKKFRVTLRSRHQKIHVGDFCTLEEAKAAYEAAFDRYRDLEYKRTNT